MQNHQERTSHQKPQPLVSFVITYYDLPVQMLCRCIDSILALSIEPEEREVIVIDDGSQVSPINGLMHYGDDIIYLRQKNGGLSTARNKGIEVATGRYIQFVDADDYLLTAAYNHCLELLHQHADADLVMFSLTDSDDAQPAFGQAQTMSGTQYMRHQNIHGTACGYLFRVKTLSELRFTPGIYHEDEEFTPQLLIRAEQVVITDAKAYHYSQRPHSITSETDNEQIEKRLNDTHDVILHLRDVADRQPQNDRLAMQRRVAQLTMDYLYNIIMLTRCRSTLEERTRQLRSEGLFPLPNRNYSAKYTWFRYMSSTTLGRTVLLNTLPLMKKER